MPFQSEKQRRYLWANEPEIARDWTDTYGSRIDKNSGGIMRVPFYEGTVIDDPLYQGLGHNLGDTLSSIGTSVSDALITPLGSATTEEGLPSLDITGKPHSGGWETDPYADFGNTNFFGEPVIDEEVVSRSFADHDTIASWLAANPNMGENIKQKARQFYESAKDVGRYGIDKAQAFKDMLLSGAGQVIDFPLAALGKVANVVNPLSPKSRNYNPRLQSQVDYLSNRGMLSGSSGSSGPYKITSGALRGKNLVSGFGTNDYGQMLQKRIDYFNKQKAKKGKLFTDEQGRRLRAAEAEKKAADKQRMEAQLAAYSGPATHSYDPKQGGGGGYTGHSQASGPAAGPMSGSYGPWS